MLGQYGFRLGDATAYRVGYPTVPEIMNSRSGYEAHGLHGLAPHPTHRIPMGRAHIGITGNMVLEG